MKLGVERSVLRRLVGAPLRMACASRTMTLKTRILCLVLGLLLASVWSLAARVSLILQRDLEHLLSDHMAASVDDTVADLERDCRLHVDLLNRIAADIGSQLLHEPAMLQRYLRQRLAMTAMFSNGMLVVDRLGTVVAGAQREDMGNVAGLADQKFLRDVMAGGRPVMGAAERDGRLQPIPVAVPLFASSGAVMGALVGFVSLSDPFMLGQLQGGKLGQTGYFLVASRHSRMIISAPQPGRVGTRLPPHGAIADLDRRLDDGFEGAGTAVSAIGVEILGVSRKIADTDWILLAAVPTKEIFAPIVTLERDIYLSASLISLVIVAILGFFLTREFGRIQQAAEAMRRMTEGQQQPLTPIPITRADEIGELKANFNRLVAERNRLDASLRSEVAGHKQAREALDDAMKRMQALSEHMTKLQDEEHRRLAVELQEQSGQELSALRLHLQVLENLPVATQARAHLHDADVIAAQALERVRKLSMDLHPSNLDDFGLYAALHAYCTERAAAAGWLLHFDAPPTGQRLDREVELACYRVAMEALTNVAAHARAAEVWVSLKHTGNELCLIMRDNGIGFDTSHLRDYLNQAKFGLATMEERVRQVAGRIGIRSSAKRGTEIVAVFPDAARQAVERRPEPAAPRCHIA